LIPLRTLLQSKTHELDLAAVRDVTQAAKVAVRAAMLMTVDASPQQPHPEQNINLRKSVVVLKI